MVSDMQQLLLHICCGPCATHVISVLREHYALIGYFFNPNIGPEDEYYRRLDAARTVCRQNDVPLLESVYEPDVFYTAVKGFEREPEGGARCKICYRLRLEETARKAAQEHIGCIASTLTLGPQKKASVINPAGEEAAARHGVRFVEGDWKKKDGFKHSCGLSREMNLYRQNYCGCIFSIREDSPPQSA